MPRQDALDVAARFLGSGGNPREFMIGEAAEVNLISRISPREHRALWEIFNFRSGELVEMAWICAEHLSSRRIARRARLVAGWTRRMFSSRDPQMTAVFSNRVSRQAQYLFWAARKADSPHFSKFWERYVVWDELRRELGLAPFFSTLFFIMLNGAGFSDRRIVAPYAERCIAGTWWLPDPKRQYSTQELEPAFAMEINSEAEARKVRNTGIECFERIGGWTTTPDAPGWVRFEICGLGH